MLYWIKSLKGLNDLIKNDIIPLRQDCHTLTVINNVRNILEEAYNFQDFSDEFDGIVENPRDLQLYLQDVCQRVFSAINIQAECNVILNDSDSIDENYENNSSNKEPKTETKNDKSRTPLSELKPKFETTQSDELNISNSNDIILIKTNQLVVEAKIIQDSTKVEEDQNVNIIQSFIKDELLDCQKANMSDSELLEPQLELNDTTKNFIFKLLKTFIDNFYAKVRERQEVLEREEYQTNKIAEYENELRILREWNSFILQNMNKPNIMDNYEN